MEQRSSTDISAEQQTEPGNPSALQAIVHETLDRSNARRSLSVREDVFVPLVFHKGELLTFKRRQIVFLDAWKPGVSLAKAAEKAGMTEDQAHRFLRTKKVRRWLHDLAREAAVQTDLSRPAKWYSMAQDWLSGKEKISEEGHELEIWKELGARAVPKPSRNVSGPAPEIHINIDPGAVDRALQRQQTIDAEIADQAT